MNVQISEDEFRLFRDLIHRECGLYFSDNKRAFLSSRIVRGEVFGTIANVIVGKIPLIPRRSS